MFTTVDELISMEGVRKSDIIADAWDVPISIVLSHFDSIDNKEGQSDDEPLTLEDIMDDIHGSTRYLAAKDNLSSGFTEALVSSATCRLLDGHHRLAAAISLGYDSVPMAFPSGSRL